MTSVIDGLQVQRGHEAIKRCEFVTLDDLRNAVRPDALPSLIRQVHQALAGAGTVSAAAPVERIPAVPVKRSVFPDHIVCLEDGKQFTTLKRHLRNAHQMTPDQYRQRWELPKSYPMIAPNSAKSRSAIAKKSGLGHKTAVSPGHKQKGRGREGR